MQKSYKKKRERKNKTAEITEEKIQIKTTIITIVSVLLFIGIFYGLNLGLTALGVYEEGYIPPIKAATEISYDEILVGNVFNKPQQTYYVLFDTFGDQTNNVYIEYLISSKEYENKIYKVDMSNPMNKTAISTESNKKATKASELKINGTTLIKIVSGKILGYTTGEDEIISYLEKLAK